MGLRGSIESRVALERRKVAVVETLNVDEFDHAVLEALRNGRSRKGTQEHEDETEAHDVHGLPSVERISPPLRRRQV
jgi:hypothetical protein